MDTVKLRKLRNMEILKKFKEGDSLTSYDSQQSWFPPRPIVKKDEEEMKRLYTGEERRKHKTLARTISDKKVSLDENSKVISIFSKLEKEVS